MASHHPLHGLRKRRSFVLHIPEGRGRSPGRAMVVELAATILGAGLAMGLIFVALRLFS